jgi:hypothetical protein
VTSRVLPAAEWSKLAGTELETLVPYLNPEKATVFVVEDDAGAVIGCWGLIPFLHAEGLWVASEHQAKSGVFRRLMADMRRELARRSEGAMWTSSMSEQVTDIITHVGGVQIPGTHYVVPVA